MTDIKQSEITQALTAYKRACNRIAELFANKQFRDPDEPEITFKSDDNLWWLGDDVGGTLFYGDLFFSRFDDIITDLRLNAPKGEIFQYDAYQLRCHRCGMRPAGYRLWLKSAPHDLAAEFAKLEHINVNKTTDDKETHTPHP